MFCWKISEDEMKRTHRTETDLISDYKDVDARNVHANGITTMFDPNNSNNGKTASSFCVKRRWKTVCVHTNIKC